MVTSFIGWCVIVLAIVLLLGQVIHATHTSVGRLDHAPGFQLSVEIAPPAFPTATPFRP